MGGKIADESETEDTVEIVVEYSEQGQFSVQSLLKSFLYVGLRNQD